MKKAFAAALSINAPIYGVKTKGLVEFETTEKDVQIYVRKMPPETARIKNEDLLQMPWPGLRRDLEEALSDRPRVRNDVRELVGRLNKEIEELKAECREVMETFIGQGEEMNRVHA